MFVIMCNYMIMIIWKQKGKDTNRRKIVFFFALWMRIEILIFHWIFMYSYSAIGLLFIILNV